MKFTRFCWPEYIPLFWGFINLFTFPGPRFCHFSVSVSYSSSVDSKPTCTDCSKKVLNRDCLLVRLHIVPPISYKVLCFFSNAHKVFHCRPRIPPLFILTLSDGIAPCPFGRLPLSLLDKWRAPGTLLPSYFHCFRRCINEQILPFILALKLIIFVWDNSGFLNKELCSCILDTVEVCNSVFLVTTRKQLTSVLLADKPFEITFFLLENLHIIILLYTWGHISFYGGITDLYKLRELI